jgi:hypothetical protein
VYQFVQDAIEKHGYTFLLDFADARQKLQEFETEVDEETELVKDIRVIVVDGHRREYYEIMNNKYNLILRDDFDELTNNSKEKHLFFSKERMVYHESFSLRKGNSKFSVFVDDTEYQLKTTRKLNKKLRKVWNAEVAEFLRHTNEWKEQIEAFRNKNLKHLRTNLFVNPAFARIVESRIFGAIGLIETLKVSIREIQNGYEKLEDKEVVLK